MIHYRTCEVCEVLRQANAFYGQADRALPDRIIPDDFDLTNLEVYTELIETITHIMNTIHRLATVVETLHMEDHRD